MHWARATDRMADYEFKAASLDGYGMNWDVTYADMKPYYDRVESFIGVSAAMEGMPQFPDGVFLPPMPLNCAEAIFTAASKSLGWPSTHRRLAQLTRVHNKRPPCHYCGNFPRTESSTPTARRTTSPTYMCSEAMRSHQREISIRPSQ